MHCPQEKKYFKTLKLLGKGTFGKVYLAESPAYNVPVCVKQITMQNPERDIKNVREEVYIVSQLKHPRIIGFLESFITGATVNIIMEFAPGGTMRNVINDHVLGPLTSQQILKYFCDILIGLEYLHIRHVIHRDLKPENILLDNKNRIKIADFGIAFVHSKDGQQLDITGTPFYLAPEILRGQGYEFKADIWSLGCILYEMCVGKNPFAFASTLNELKAVLSHSQMGFFDCRNIQPTYGPVWMKLCERMLTYHPNGRCSLPEIVRFDPRITFHFYHLYFDYEY